MFSLPKDKTLITLAILLALTLTSWLLLSLMIVNPKTIGSLLLLVAFVKLQLIISQYMELYKNVLPVRIIFWLWTTGVGVMSIGMYLR